MWKMTGRKFTPEINAKGDNAFDENVGNGNKENVEIKAKAVDDALDNADGMVGGGYAATDVNNVVGGKDDQFDITGSKENTVDAAEEVLGVDSHARRQGIGGRPVLDEVTG